MYEQSRSYVCKYVYKYVYVSWEICSLLKKKRKKRKKENKLHNKLHNITNYTHQPIIPYTTDIFLHPTYFPYNTYNGYNIAY